MPESALLLVASTAGDFESSYVLGQATRVAEGILTAKHNWDDIRQMDSFSVISARNLQAQSKTVHVVIRPSECEVKIFSQNADLIIIGIPQKLWSVIGAKVAKIEKPSKSNTVMLMTVEEEGFAIQHTHVMPLKARTGFSWHLAATTNRNSGAGFYKAGVANVVVAVHVGGGVVDRNPSSPGYGCAKENYASGLGMLKAILERKSRLGKPETTDSSYDRESEYEYDRDYDRAEYEAYEEIERVHRQDVDEGWEDPDFEETYYEGDRESGTAFSKLSPASEFDARRQKVIGMTWQDLQEFEARKRRENGILWSDYSDDEPFYQDRKYFGHEESATNRGLNYQRRSNIRLPGSKPSQAIVGPPEPKVKATKSLEDAKSSSLVATKQSKSIGQSESAKLSLETKQETSASTGLNEEPKLKSEASNIKPESAKTPVLVDSKPSSTTESVPLSGTQTEKKKRKRGKPKTEVKTEVDAVPVPPVNSPKPKGKEKHQSQSLSATKGDSSGHEKPQPESALFDLDTMRKFMSTLTQITPLLESVVKQSGKASLNSASGTPVVGAAVSSESAATSSGTR